MKNKHRPLATFQVDVDSLRIPLAQLGYTLQGDDVAVYSNAIPEFLDLFGRHGIAATFYCVGEDAEVEINLRWMSALVQAGHEVGNHSLSHDWRYAEGTAEEKRHQLEKAHGMLEAASGGKIKGFRGPGFFVDREHLKALIRLGYEYDSSILPSPYAPAAMSIGLRLASRSERPKLKYGDIRLGLAPRSPYFPDVERPWARGRQREICEVPVSVAPWLRMPFHSTYVFPLKFRYFLTCASLVYRMGLPLVFVMHGIDLLSEKIEPRLSPFSTFRLMLEERRKILDRVIAWTEERFTIMTSLELARHYKQTGRWSISTTGGDGR